MRISRTIQDFGDDDYVCFTWNGAYPLHSMIVAGRCLLKRGLNTVLNVTSSRIIGGAHSINDLTRTNWPLYAPRPKSKHAIGRCEQHLPALHIGPDCENVSRETLVSGRRMKRFLIWLRQPKPTLLPLIHISRGEFTTRNPIV